MKELMIQQDEQGWDFTERASPRCSRCQQGEWLSFEASLDMGMADRFRRFVTVHDDAFTLRGGLSECVRGRLPLPEALRDELGVLLLASAVQHLEV
jgi:hypothetical protein